jgi:hypothetical protein
MTNFVKIPFEVDGINFVSRYNPDSPMGIKIAQIPQEMFIAMNKQCVREIISNVSELTREELLAELERVNENGTEAFIELGENA